MLVKDSISGMQLFAGRFISKNKKDLVPFLRYLKSIFGTSLVIIRDGGDGIVSALTEAFPNVHQIYCHFHFLRALGHALFDHYYKSFKKIMDKLGVKGKLKGLCRMVEKRLQKEKKPFI
jgi:transposase-like protein